MVNILKNKNFTLVHHPMFNGSICTEFQLTHTNVTKKGLGNCLSYLYTTPNNFKKEQYITFGLHMNSWNIKPIFKN